MNLQEILLNSRPAHDELTYVLHKSRSAMSTPEELETIFKIACRHVFGWSISIFADNIFHSLKNNPICDEDFILKINCVYFLYRRNVLN